jgi:WD40 repeat protein/DNA-binding SARP family transcriptional activator
VSIGVLGPLTLGGATRLGPRDRTVLAALVVGGEEALSLDQLAEAVWGAEPPASWRKVLHGCVARLRRALGVDAIETVATGYRLAVAADDIDARRFDRLVRRGREQLALGDADRALFVIDEALGLWRGRPLADVEGWEPGRTEAGRLEESRLDAEELRLEAALRAGRHREILAEAHARVGEAPLRERRWALLALAQYRAGQQSESLASLRRIRALLNTELGVDPGQDLVTLERAILRHEPSLLAAEPPPDTSTTCPYRGLIAYDVEDAETFFGRDVETAECLRRLASAGVLAVVGASGSGKSSLVRAGVVAALRRQGRAVVVVTPGRAPMDSLPPVPQRGPAPVLVVDQCEEVFTLCRDPAERARYLTALAERAARAGLVVVLRADRFAEASAHPRFARLTERGLYLLGAMPADHLRTAIEAPASQAGLLLEPGLVDLLVRDVEGEPGALPLLSHALRQTWRRREGRTLTVAGYRDAGGIQQAVANTAEELYDRMPEEQRPLLRDMLLRLVTPTLDGAPSRSRVPRRLVATSATHDSMIERLVAARLVISDDGVVELAHEALARAWPRLRTWLDEDADGQRIRRHLTASADAWDGMGRPDSEVYRGARLAGALEWHRRSRVDLNPTEEAFLTAARNLAAAEESLALHRARQQARVNRRLRALLAAATVLMLLAAGAGVVASRQARRANATADVADARRIGANASTVSQADLSLLLAVQALRMHDSPATRASLLAALNRHPRLIGAVQDPDHTPGDIEISADGRSLVVVSGSRIGRFDTSTRAGGWHTIEATDAAVLRGGVAIRPDGGQIAVPFIAPRPSAEYAEDIPAVRLINTDGRVDAIARPGTLAHYPDPVALSYSPDGRRLAITYRQEEFANSATMVWDLANPAEPVARIITPWLTDFVHFSRDGTLLYTAHRATDVDDPTAPPPNAYASVFDARGPVTVIDVAGGRRLRQFAAPGRPLGLSPDGRLLVTAAEPPEGERATTGSAVVLVDSATGEHRARLDDGATADVRRARFSPDGRLVAVTAGDTTTVWAVETGERLESFPGHTRATVDAAFSPDSATLYTSDENGTTLVWDLRGDRRFAPRKAVIDAVPASVPEAAIAPDGRHAALNWVRTEPDGRTHGLLQMVDLRTGRTAPPVDTGHGRYHGPAWRPDSGQLATAGDDGFVRTWDPASGRLLHERQISQIGVPGIAYSRDGARLVVTDNRVLQLDPDGLRPVADLIRPRWDLKAPTVGKDDRTVAAIPTSIESDPSVSAPVPSNTIVLVDLHEGRTRVLGIDVTGVGSAVSPDGRRLAVAGQDGEILLLDLRSGARVRHPVVGHEGPAGPVAFSADGGTIVAGGRDGRVSVWDGATGDLLGTVTVAPAGVSTYPAFLPDGRTAVIVASDGTVHTLDTDPRSWIAYACEVVNRDMTGTEWSQTVGERPYQRTCHT